MNARNQDIALQDYLDALLQPGAPVTSTDTQADPAPHWRVCRLGRLQVLLPAASLGTPIAARDVSLPATWHRAHVRIGATDRRVAELGACIAPNLAAAPIDTLLPVTGSDWLLAVAGIPAPLALVEGAIEWRAKRHSRPWLAGMTRDGRYMALDVRALIEHVSGVGIEEPQA